VTNETYAVNVVENPALIDWQIAIIVIFGVFLIASIMLGAIFGRNLWRRFKNWYEERKGVVKLKPTTNEGSATTRNTDPAMSSRFSKNDTMESFASLGD
jgi:hypothetical protein